MSDIYSSDTRALITNWVRERRITEVECYVSDQSGIARGKILPAHKFLGSLEGGLRLPESLFTQTVTGMWGQADILDETERDIQLLPDHATLCPVPWYKEPTAQVICDVIYHDGKPVEFSPRALLRRVLALYDAQGWQPVIAPELEFFLTAVNTDPDYPLEPPVGRSRRTESGRQAFSIDAVNEFDPIFEDVYDWCDEQGIDVDTLTHEAGAAQMEINFNHGDPLSRADQAFMFKRTVREAALRHGIYATFMAKPMETQPGSAMHIHQSVYDQKTQQNLFSEEDGKPTALFLHHIGGLQRYTPDVMPMLAPNVNSYRRLQRYTDAPINLCWGWENRTAGLRIPESTAQARRVENRVPGADANPYLAIAASLVCGYLGMVEKIMPDEPIRTSAYQRPVTLPSYLPDSINQMSKSEPINKTLGELFVKVLTTVKSEEHAAYQSVISSWEREHLLLNV